MDKRYLYYDVLSKPTKTWAGLKHQRHLLQGMLREAHILNRTAVLHPMCIASMHNFGKRQLRPFSDIFDLDASRVLQSGVAAKALDWIDKDDLDFESIAPAQTKIIGAEQNHFIDEETNRRYQMIIRDTSTMIGDKWDPADSYINKKTASGELPRKNVALKMAKPIREAADGVIDVLSDKLPPPSDQDFLPRYETIGGRPQMPPGAYACLHLRLGDRVVYEYEWKSWVRPDRFLKMIYRFLPTPEAPLYIMSNMEDTVYHDELKKRYRVFTARDFAELNRRLPPPGAIADDEHLLAREIEYKAHLPGGSDAQGRSLRAAPSPLAGPDDPDNTFVYATEELIYSNAYARINTDFLNSFQFSLDNPYRADARKARSTPLPPRTAESAAGAKNQKVEAPKSAANGADRYLMHEHASAGGVLRNKRRLSTLLCEAAQLGRIAVITPWRMDGRYNRGQAQRRSPADFVDLEQARVYGEGLNKQGAPARWIMEAQLDSGERREIGADDEADDEANHNAPLLARRFENLEQEERAAAQRRRAALPAAERIRTLAEDIQYRLGDDCSPSARDALATRTWQSSRFGNGVYHCMQLPSAAAKASWLARSQIIMLRKCRQMFGMMETEAYKKVRLYVIGDAALGEYRHIIEKFADARSAGDFENLRPFLSAEDDACDLFTVFAVEALIMRDAQIKMHPSSEQLKEIAITDPNYHIIHFGYFIGHCIRRVRHALRRHKYLKMILRPSK